jgi:hypothetical protein
MSGNAVRVRGLAAALLGGAGAVALLALGSRAIGSGPVRFVSPGPADAGLASTSLRVDEMSLHPAASDGAIAGIDLVVTNTGRRDAVGVGYVLEDAGVVVAYEEAVVLHGGQRDLRHLQWVPVGHGRHTLRVVVGDGNVHWVRHELRTGVFADSILPARRHRSAGALALAGIAGALAAALAGALLPRLRLSPIEVVPEPAPDLAGS